MKNLMKIGGKFVLKEFEYIRQDIRNSAIKLENHREAIKKSKSFLKILNKLCKKEAGDDKWFCYHDIGWCNKKLGNIDEAIRNELIAITFTNHNILDCDYRYIDSIWLITECYVIKGNIDEAIVLYKTISKFYRMIHDDVLRCCTVFNLGKALKNTKAMLNVIKIYESKTLKSVVKTFGDFQYDDILKEMYSSLMDLYMLDSRQQSACFKLLYMIKSKDFKKELGKKLQIA